VNVANDALQKGNNALTKANDAVSKRMMRSGRSPGGTHYGRIDFSPPFDGDIDPGKIRVVATPDAWGNDGWWFYINVHIVSIDARGFVYNVSARANGQSGGWTPGEAFSWIATAF
jgi:hypothetical protein